MFEIIKLILETVGKFLKPEAVAVYLRDKKKRKVGTELFLLYISINEIVACGEEILNRLEGYCERMERHLSHNDDEYALTAGKWVELLIMQQRINMGKFGKTMLRLCAEVQLIDAESYRLLRNAVDLRLVRLRNLSTV